MTLVPDAAVNGKVTCALVLMPITDEARLREVLRKLHEVAPDLPATWRVEPPSVALHLDMADLLADLGKEGIVGCLRRAGLVSQDICIDGKWYACIAVGEEGESRG